jgi:hypothetical protein
MLDSLPFEPITCSGTYLSSFYSRAMEVASKSAWVANSEMTRDARVALDRMSESVEASRSAVRLWYLHLWASSALKVP